MNPDLYLFSLASLAPGMAGGQVRFYPEEDEFDGGGTLTYASIPAEIVLQFLGDEEDDELSIPASGMPDETVFDGLAADAYAQGGTVVTAFGGEATGTEGGDLLMGDGGVDAAVIAELLAGLADYAA